jgi:hypothetical protein
VFWFPFITVTASFVGGMVEGWLAGDRSVPAWLLRLVLPLLIGAVWFVLVVGPDPRVRGGRGWFDLACFTGFAIPAWVGVFAVWMARRERGE